MLASSFYLFWPLSLGCPKLSSLKRNYTLLVKSICLKIYKKKSIFEKQIFENTDFMTILSKVSDSFSQEPFDDQILPSP